MGRRRRRIPDDAVDLRRDGHGRCPDASIEDRVRLGPWRDLRSAGPSRPALRNGGAVRGRRHAAIRVRTIVGTALAMIVTGLALATQITVGWQLWLTWGVIIGISTGATANVLGATIATRW